MIVTLARLPAAPSMTPNMVMCRWEPDERAGRRVLVAEVLLALPHWPLASLRRALTRLEAEGLVCSLDSRAMLRKHSIGDAVAVQLTPEGLRAAEELLPPTPTSSDGGEA